MTWLKVNDRMFNDAKFAALPASAWRLHLTAAGYVLNSNGGDRVIPRTALRHLGPRLNRARDVRRLIADGMWERVGMTSAGVPGYRIVFLMDDQPTMDEIESQREFGRIRAERNRRHRRGDHSQCSPQFCEVLRRPQGQRSA